jgi:hypothetical protein
VLRPQAFSASRRFDSNPHLPALFRAGHALGIHTFRGFPLLVAGRGSHPDLPSVPFAVRSTRALARSSLPVRRGFEGFRILQVRCTGAGFIRRPATRSSLGVTPLEVPPQPWPRASTRPPLMGFGMPPESRSPPSSYLLCRVSKNREAARSLSRPRDLPEVSATKFCPTKRVR